MLLLKKTLDTHLIPKNVSNFWNLGSILGLLMVFQVISGLMIASIHPPSSEFNFFFSSMVNESVSSYWLVKLLHMNMASLIFFLMYLHIGRGLYYHSYSLPLTWLVGLLIYVMTMASAFLGYVLPMNQMSFWAASVIINLFSEIPFVGDKITILIWGSVTVGSDTVSRFFIYHYMLPFVILYFILVHVMFLHKEMSSNPLGLGCGLSYNMFQPIYFVQDLSMFILIILGFFMLFMSFPDVFCSNDNFLAKDNKVTPHHIQPEWYFLFLYTILRSIPSKSGGVVALVLAILVMFLLPLFPCGSVKGFEFYPMSKFLFWSFVFCIMSLTWIGMKPAEDPYVFVGQIMTFFYFFYFFIMVLVVKFWDFVLLKGSKS